MAMPPDLPIVDHHCHLSPNGEGVAAARRFRSAGGSHLFLATQNYEAGPPMDLESYRRQFATTAALGHAVEQETGVRVFLTLAPYPVDLIAQVERLGAAAALELGCAALDLAGHLVEEQGAVALGEVGRPHFPYPPAATETVEAVFRHALEVGRDVGCPVVVHSEELSAEGFAGLAGLAARASFPVHRLVKHYQRTLLPPSEYRGVAPSYVARRELVEGALPTAGPWFLETDFLDDPRRPGAVMDLATVPRRALQWAARGPEMVERLRVPFQEAIQSVYGFTPETRPMGAP